jgi:hypothetical protein
VTGNTDSGGAAAAGAGGVGFAGGGTFTLDNTVVAQNSATLAGTAPDIRGAVSSGGNNFVGVGGVNLTGLGDGTGGNRVGTAAAPLDPQLGPLQDNGGPTRSRKPLAGSPLLDAGSAAAAAALATDQRGFLRVVGAGVDIGSVEYQPPQVSVALAATPAATVPAPGAVTFTATVSPAAPGPNNPVSGTVTFLLGGSTPLGSAPLDASGTATLTVRAPAPLPVGADQVTARYEGDASYASALSPAFTQQVQRPVATVGVFDPATATWYLRDSDSPGAADVTPFRYGAPGWLPVVGDWNGNGTFTVGVFDPSTATFYLRNSNTPGAPDITVPYGAPGWLPVVGDWNGDGRTTLGVFDPRTATWYLRNSNSPGAPDVSPFAYGGKGWMPVVGAWNGGGVSAVGVVDPATETWYLKDASAPGAPDVTPFAYGAPGWQPVVGDWGGDGTWTPGVLQPRGGLAVWDLRDSPSAGAPSVAPFAYGAAGWLPVAGDWAFPREALRAAGGEGPGAPTVRQADLDTTLAAALGRLRQAGVSQGTLARLAAVTAVVQPLPPGTLGLAQPSANRIVLDDDGAGHGWFVDLTPAQDEEFVGGQATPGSAAAGQEDLLTAVLHELGHVTGLQDDAGGDVMAGLLPTGTRRTEALDRVFAQATVPQGG